MGNILQTIKTANDGKLVSGLSQACGITQSQAEQALETLVPTIAQKILAKADNDPQDYQDLMDVVDDEEQVNYLNKPDWSFSIAAIEDGQDILKHLYGSVSEAITADLRLEHDEATTARLANFAATYCVAAMASRNQALFLSDAPENDEPSGFWGMIIAALLKGLMQSLTRRRPRRRYRRRTYGRKRKRKRRSSSRRKSTTSRRRRRRKKTPSLNDLIGDLIRG